MVGMIRAAVMHPAVPQAQSVMMTAWGDRLLRLKPVLDSSAYRM